MVSPMMVAKVYQAVQNQGLSTPSPPAATDDGPGFAELVKGAVNDAITQSKTAETKMIGQAQGKVELIDAVTAISSAQASLNTVLAVRDQVISAYQQIMQMPI
jgi:flagellar hook-basal body complex protein FliE